MLRPSRSPRPKGPTTGASPTHSRGCHRPRTPDRVVSGQAVKPRVLWRRVYLDVVVAVCGCSWRWVSGAQAASCSAGVRMPMAQWGRMVPVPVDPLGGGDHGRRRYPARGPGQRMSSAMYSELSASARAKPKGVCLGTYGVDGVAVGQSCPVADGPVLHAAVASGAPGPSGRRPCAGAAR